MKGDQEKTYDGKDPDLSLAIQRESPWANSQLSVPHRNSTGPGLISALRVFSESLIHQFKALFRRAVPTDSGHQSCHPALYTLQVPSALLNVAIVRRDLQV
jgi:hypothetical protein